MRKFLFVLILLLPVSVWAQTLNPNDQRVYVPNKPKSRPAVNVASIKPGGHAPAMGEVGEIDGSFKPKAEEKAKPIILDQAKLKELQIANLLLENAQLKLKAAQDAVQLAQGDVTKAGDGVAAFWKAIGINPAELSTKWQASNGVNGDIILTKKEEEAKKN